MNLCLQTLNGMIINFQTLVLKFQHKNNFWKIIIIIYLFFQLVPKILNMERKILLNIVF